LYDVTLDRRFSALCGYTQTELESVFAPELDQVNLEELKQWYNGYNWTGEAVYNPFDILLFLEDPLKTYKPYWIETGNATFLIDKLIGERVNLALLEKGFVDNEVLSSFEVGDISPIALL
ncbi:AAA family ATPase, partial [Pasteurella multocida]|uniref:AAA family ATPase n=1 Tax=Pasteurella multocida TaxID=747 RepID=UPI00227B05E0